MSAVSALGSPSVCEPAEGLAYKHRTVSVALDELHAGALIQQARVRDGRERRVNVNAAGSRFLRRLYVAQLDQE